MYETGEFEVCSTEESNCCIEHKKSPFIQTYRGFSVRIRSDQLQNTTSLIRDVRSRYNIFQNICF